MGKAKQKARPRAAESSSVARTADTVVWDDDARFTCRGVPFWTPLSDLTVEDRSGLPVWKPRDMVERYFAALDTVQPKNVVEIGIYRGGSTALLGIAGNFKRMVSFELSPDRLPMLDDFIVEHSLADKLRPHYAVDQADAAKVSRILDIEFGDEPIDLVIDDASHLLAPTRASFDTLFPRLRPGGMFIIEDWACDHLQGFGVRKRALANGEPERARKSPMGQIARRRKPPLSIFATEAWLTMLERPDLISRVEIDPHWISVWKSPDAPCGADPDFRLINNYHDDYDYT